MLQMLVGALFDRAFRRYTRAFEERAQAVYGAGAAAARGDELKRRPRRWRGGSVRGRCRRSGIPGAGSSPPLRGGRDVHEADRLGGLPPPGPATPVTATAMSACECASAPSAMARATGSLTAPCAASSSRHAQHSILAALE